MLLGHHSGSGPRGSVDARDGEGGDRGVEPDLHVGWDLVHSDWGDRQRESRGRRRAGLIEAAWSFARRLLQLVLRAGVAVACVRSASPE